MSTPGPWTAIIEKDDERVVDTYVIDADEDVVIRPSERLSEANARLIAAAPDMLAALKALITSIDLAHENYSTLTEARAAIAKATGTGGTDSSGD